MIRHGLPWVNVVDTSCHRFTCVNRDEDVVASLIGGDSDRAAIESGKLEVLNPRQSLANASGPWSEFQVATIGASEDDPLLAK